MIDFHTKLVAALKTIGIPVEYEMFLSSETKIPCISYMELSNIADEEGDTIGYSNIQYQIKVWSDKVADLQKYSVLIDKLMRPLGFTRIGCREISDNNSSMIQKIMTYEGLALEDF